MAPFDLPAQASMSGIRSRSLKGHGDNFNALWMDDAQGAEKMTIHAERDLQHTTENDARELVGHDRHLYVT
jgi:type VI secretion system secreted protein VgrG